MVLISPFEYPSAWMSKRASVVVQVYVESTSMYSLLVAMSVSKQGRCRSRLQDLPTPMGNLPSSQVDPLVVAADANLAAVIREFKCEPNLR